MPEAIKLTHVHDILGEIEVTYGVLPVMVGAEDGIFAESRVTGEISYIHSGDRSPDAGRGTPPPPGGPVGRQGNLTIPVLARGSLSAYSASVFPADVHDLLRAAGHLAVLDATPAAESWTYTPIITGYESMGLEVYAEGQMWPIRGAYADMTYAIEGVYLQYEFNVQGIADKPSDVAIPAITHLSHGPPKATAIGLNHGTGTPFVPVLRSASFAMGRELAPRLDFNAVAGHAGFAGGKFLPTIELQVEKATLKLGGPPWYDATDFDPYEIRDLAITDEITFTLGSVQYNRMTFTAVNATIINVTEDEDGPTGLWNLTYGLYPSNIGGVDAYAIVYD